MDGRNKGDKNDGSQYSHRKELGNEPVNANGAHNVVLSGHLVRILASLVP